MKKWLGSIVAFLSFFALGARAGEAIWTPNPLVPVFGDGDYADKAGADAAIRIVGTRNGAFSGQAVLVSAEAGRCPEAKAGELKSTDGKSTIPASAVEVWYALPDGSMGDIDAKPKERKFRNRFDALLSAPTGEEGKVHVVWIVVNVPADAAPGEYEGKLSWAAREIPVKLSVAAWRLPDPKDYTLHVGFVQSPESVALQYGVPMWGDKHMALLGKSMELLGKVGNRTVFIPVISKCHYGETDGMIRWVKNGNGYNLDFAPMEKYLDLYIEKVGKPDVVGFYFWDMFMSKFRGDPKPTMVTLLKPDGTTEEMQAPAYGEEGSEAFWKPVADGIRERLAARKLGAETFMIGVSGDRQPKKKETEFFKKIAPEARWVSRSHPPHKVINGVQVGYLAFVWGVKMAYPPELNRRKYGWRQKPGKTIITAFPRYGASFVHKLGDNAKPGICQVAWEASTQTGLRGIGQLAFDFWPVIKGRRRKRSIIGRYHPGQPGTWAQLTLSNATNAVVHPGPEGALPTIRFELMRQGIAAAEARVFIEKALTDKDAAAKLGAELSKKCQDLLDDRCRAYLSANNKRDKAWKGWTWYAEESGWQQREAKLYAAAAEVSAKLNSN